MSRFNHNTRLIPCALLVLRLDEDPAPIPNLASLKMTEESIIALNPFLRTIIESCVSSAFTLGLILDLPIASVRNPQIDPSNIGVESIADSPKRIE